MGCNLLSLYYKDTIVHYGILMTLKEHNSYYQNSNIYGGAFPTMADDFSYIIFYSIQCETYNVLNCIWILSKVSES